MRCPNCNEKVLDTVNFCHNCGFNLKEYRESLNEQKDIKEQPEDNHASTDKDYSYSDDVMNIFNIKNREKSAEEQKAEDEKEKELRENPYIKEIKVNKKGINSLKINIKENKIAYYFESDGKIKAINNEGVVVEELAAMDDRNLIKLIGIDLSGKVVGDKISDDVNIPDTLEKFYNIIEAMPQEYVFSQIDIEDLNNIVCYIQNVEIMIGDSSDLIDKMNLALNAIEQGVISKGYIDMSFNGPPVIKQIN